MAEKVIVRQGRDYVTGYQANTGEGAAAVLREVHDLSGLTPYGMILAGLGGCTALVVNKYAEYHGLPVSAVVLTLEYQRSFKADCERCEQTGAFEERISMAVALEGDLSPQQKEKLFKIALQCPLHKMFHGGIPIDAEPAP